MVANRQHGPIFFAPHYPPKLGEALPDLDYFALEKYKFTFHGRLEISDLKLA